MRVTLDKLMNKLGVGRVLCAYEAQPWFHYDEEKGITCSAEVRVGPNAEDVEVEIQFLKDENNENDEDRTEGEETSSGSTGPEQIMRMRAQPVGQGEWSPTMLIVKGENYVNKFHNWEEKSCDFFRACIQSIQMGELPEIDSLLEKELSDDSSSGSGRRGRIGRKSPSIKPGALLGMKKGM